MAVNIFFKTNSADTVKELDKVEKKLQSVQKESSIKQGIARLQGQIKDGPLGGTPIGGALTDMAGKLGSVTKLLNPWAAAIAACTGAVTALQQYAKAAVEKGMEAANQSETANARLTGQLSSKGIISSEPITAALMKMQENGVASVEHLTDAFTRLVPVLHGNAQEAVEWVARLADMEAATGIGADQMAALLMRIEQTGELESKTALKLEKNGIPIWKELAKVYDMDIDGVKALSKAHKLGVAEIKTALKNATAAYQGTAASLSSTTQGSKSSMQSAEALAFKGAADGYNDKMREYYQGRQAYFDALADDSQWRQDIQLVGEAEAQLEILWQEICDIASKIGNGALGVLGNIIDSLKGHTTAGEIEARRIGRGREDLGRLGQNMQNFDAATAKNAFESLFKTLGEENKKLSEYVENWENSTADERAQWYEVCKAQRAYIAALTDTGKQLGQLANAQERAEAERAAREAAKADRRKNVGENAKLQEQAAMNGKDPEAIAAAHLFSSAGLLVQAFEELDGKIKAHVALTDEEIETYKELEKPYQSIMKLRAEELGEYQKSLAAQKSLDDSLVSTAEALRAEDERRMQNGEDMRREYGESEAYNRAFDALKRLGERLDNTDLNGGEKASVMSKELARMLADARKSAVTATQETLEAKGLHSVKDFKFTDFNVDEKTLQIQEDIKRASEDANKILDEIALKLPTPAMAQ